MVNNYYRPKDSLLNQVKGQVGAQKSILFIKVIISLMTWWCLFKFANRQGTVAQDVTDCRPPSCPDIVLKCHIPPCPPVTSSQSWKSPAATGGFAAHKMTVIPPKASWCFHAHRTLLGYLFRTHTQPGAGTDTHSIGPFWTPPEVPLRDHNNVLWNRHLWIKCKIGIPIWSKRSHGFTGKRLLNHKNGYQQCDVYYISSEHISCYICHVQDSSFVLPSGTLKKYMEFQVYFIFFVLHI